MSILNLSKPRLAIGIWLLVLLITLFTLNNTTPDRIGPQGITLFFGLLYVFFSLSLNALSVSYMYVSRHKHWHKHWRPVYAFVYGFIPTIALALQSLDQLILRDILIFVSLAALIAFYITRRSQSS